MKGTIRTKEICPKCAGQFKNIEDRILICQKCFMIPAKFYINIFWRGKQRKIYFNNRGHHLLSYDSTKEVLKEIRLKIDKHTFNLSDYKAINLLTLQFGIYAKAFFGRLEQAHKAGKFSPNTIKSFKNDIFKHLIPYFGPQDIRDIEGSDLEDFYSALPESLSLAMRKHIFGVLHLILKTALKRNDISGIPLFPTIIVPEPQTRWIDEATQEKILERIPHIHRPIFIFMVKQGVRPGEARAIHWEDINIKQKTVDIHSTFAGRVYQAHTKTKKNRVIPLDDEVYDLFKLGVGKSGFVFTSKGEPYVEGSILNKIWNKAEKAAGLKHIKLYEGTRHSFLTQAANAGVNAHQLQRFGGHATSKMLERYVHINMDALQMVLDKKKRNSS